MIRRIVWWVAATVCTLAILATAALWIRTRYASDRMVRRSVSMVSRDVDEHTVIFSADTTTWWSRTNRGMLTVGWTHELGGWHDNMHSIFFLEHDDPSDFQPWGSSQFAFVGVQVAHANTTATRLGDAEHYWAISLPLWLMLLGECLFAATLSMMRLRGVVRPGCCKRCGYDVRVQLEHGAASRCPECGLSVN